MVRRVTSMAILLLASLASAQRYPGRSTPGATPAILAGLIDRMEGELRTKTAGLRLQLVAGAVQLTPQVLALRLQLRGQLPAPHLGPLEGEDPQPDRHVAGVANGLGHISHARERTGRCKQLQATGTASPRLNSRLCGHVGSDAGTS